MNDSPSIKDGRVEWGFASYIANPPIGDRRVLLTKSVRHMSPTVAREVAADLVKAADFAESLHGESAMVVQAWGHQR